MDIKDTFLKLTSKTYPNGTESELFDLLPSNLETDGFGNRFIEIGENSTCMFTSHLDTATSANTAVNHVFDGDIIKTDGKSILGADDKAGVTIMFYMIANKIPGIYYFFLGEEVGCLGSRWLSDLFKENENEKFQNVNKVISFDRRGTDSVITYQSSTRCCSDTFANALAEQLNKEPTFSYKPDPTGIYTDSAKFTSIYPECTNISVGYRSEHTHREEQNIAHLITLGDACLKVDWENLPVERDPKTTEYRSYGGGYYSGGWGDWDDWDDYYGGGVYGGYVKNHTPVIAPKPETKESIHFWDGDFNYVSKVKIDKKLNSLLEIDFSEERITCEDYLVEKLLEDLEVDYDTYTYDGLKLVVCHKAPASHTTTCSRDELSEFIPELDFWRKEINTY